MQGLRIMQIADSPVYIFNNRMARHEIRTHAHLEALLLIAEPGWRTELKIERAHHPRPVSALFVPRARRWIVAEEPNDP